MSSKGINKVNVMGYLGADPVTRYLASGNAVTNISVATSESWKDKQSGQPVERTEWHRIVFFNRLAEIAGEYLRKGSRVYVEGKMVTRKWQDDNGIDRYTTEVHASDLQLIDFRLNEGQGSGASSTPASAAQDNKPAIPSRPLDDFDDDIPFE